MRRVYVHGMGIVAAVACCAISSAAEPRLDAPEVPLADAMERAGQIVQAVPEGDLAARLEACTKVFELLYPHRGRDQAASETSAAIGLQLQSEEYRNGVLSNLFERSGAGGNPLAKQRIRGEFATRIFSLADQCIRSIIANGSIDPTEMKALLGFAKGCSDMVDDINDANPLTASPNAVTKMLARLQAAEAMARNADAPKASELAGILKTLDAQIPRKIRHLGVAPLTTIEMIEMPLYVSAALVDHNRECLEEITSAVDEVANAMNGDPDALGRLQAHAREIEKKVSSKAYGKKILDAVINTLVSRVPFGRTLIGWFAGSPDLDSWTGMWSTTWADIVVTPGGKLEPVAGLLKRYTTKITVLYASENRIAGTWFIADIGVRGHFDWVRVTPDRFSGSRQEENGKPLMWHGTRQHGRIDTIRTP